MAWAVGCCVLLFVVLASLIAAYENELRSMARWLDDYEQGSGARLGVGFGSPGIRAVASGLNRLLDAERSEHERAVLERKAFRRDLASLSHDIRTPLAGAKGYLELYQTRRDVEARERCVREAASRLDAMNVLVDGLFEYTRALDAGVGAPLGRVEVYPVVAHALLGLYPAFAERGWEPTVDFEDEGLAALADPEALERVVSNLAVNALRYGAGAPSVVQRGRRVTFSNPVAAPEAIDVSRLFERFYRADPARTGRGGGLGLAIVAELCGAMGMEVAATLEGDVLSITVKLGE